MQIATMRIASGPVVYLVLSDGYSGRAAPETSSHSSKGPHTGSLMPGLTKDGGVSHTATPATTRNIFLMERLYVSYSLAHDLQCCMGISPLKMS
jgi:hypothetical protein